MSHAITNVRRACGDARQEGAVYMECTMSPFGKPIEAFLIDPPMILDIDSLGISPRGVTLIADSTGTHHVFDWIGSRHYPSVADFIEEVRRFGPSRRLPATLDFELLTPASRMVFIHARAHIDNHRDYSERASYVCPKMILGHLPAQELDGSLTLPTEMCVSLYWEDVEPENLGRVECEALEAAGLRTFQRVMPGFSYVARCRPWGIVPQYTPAAFMAMPISNLSVVRAADGSHQSALDRVSRSSIGHSLDVC